MLKMSKLWKPNFRKKTPTQLINLKISDKNLKDNSSWIKNLYNKTETKMPPLLNFPPGSEKCPKSTKIPHFLLTLKKLVSKPWLHTISFTNLLKNITNCQKTCKTSWLKIKFWENCTEYLIILVLIWKKLKSPKNRS